MATYVACTKLYFLRDNKTKLNETMKPCAATNLSYSQVVNWTTNVLKRNLIATEKCDNQQTRDETRRDKIQ